MPRVSAVPPCRRDALKDRQALPVECAYVRIDKIESYFPHEG